MLTLSKNAKQIFKKFKKMYSLNVPYPEARWVKSQPGYIFSLALWQVSNLLLFLKLWIVQADSIYEGKLDGGKI